MKPLEQVRVACIWNESGASEFLHCGLNAQRGAFAVRDHGMRHDGGMLATKIRWCDAARLSARGYKDDK